MGCKEIKEMVDFAMEHLDENEDGKLDD